MKKETLIKLIEHESTKCQNIEDFKNEVFRLLELYENDSSQSTIINSTYGTTSYPNTIPCNYNKVPFSTICPCNPANGGSGICGCIMGNTMVDKPTY